MAKTKRVQAKPYAKQVDTGISFDGVYLFKMVLYLLLGSVWIKASNGTTVDISIPVGLLIGLLFTLHEHFQIDRKIEYAILLVAMLFGYFAPYGLYINF
ncbi:MAG TPA: hypothetical protein VFM05_07405 [Candidatus Saccharimonadales bacterium]|nr:hypothetical protein [Candidatus Saccharimonadales bacterium]